VGGQREIKVNVRIISATNRKLEEELKKTNFREDLYYRLNVFPIEMSPLRMHREDLPGLIQHFISRIALENNIRPKQISNDALELFLQYDFPGNIRELRNLIERLLIITAADQITEKDVAKVLPHRQENGISSDSLLYSTLEETERDLIRKTLDENRWQISKVARVLGLERSHLYKKMKRYSIV